VLEIAPAKESIVKLYSSSVPIFEKFGIERQIKTSFGRTAAMSKGAYLIIAKNQEDTALEVNLLAASEIARQLRLRDMGGIIVVDFIDMVKAPHRRKLFDHLRDEMKDDRAKHKILPPSKFGLIQITRQRVRPEMNIKTTEENPNGNGQEVEAPIVLIDKINADLERLLKGPKANNGITLNIHPFIAALYVSRIPF